MAHGKDKDIVREQAEAGGCHTDNDNNNDNNDKYDSDSLYYISTNTYMSNDVVYLVVVIISRSSYTIQTMDNSTTRRR